jgi:hypothetical protein
MAARNAHAVHSYSNRVYSGRRRVGWAQHASASHPTRVRPVADRAYLDRLAHRLAVDAGLPLPVAKARVMALAISARP